jgi:hypothetical protein
MLPSWGVLSTKGVAEPVDRGLAVRRGTVCNRELRGIRLFLGTGVKIASVAALFSWLRGCPARVMDHLGE